MKNIIADLENILEKCGEKEVLIEALEDALEKSENSIRYTRKENLKLLDDINALEQEIKSLK